MTGSPGPSDEARRAVARSLAIDAHTAAVVTALNAAGVPSVLLKGPSIARWLYTDGTPRPYGDTDLLVPDERMPDVERVLTELGLVPLPRPRLELGVRAHALDWARPDGSGHVDLHWTLPLAGAPERVWSVVARDAELMVLGGCEVRVGSEPLRTLFVVLHALHHGPEAGKPLEDLGRAVEQLDDQVWSATLRLAEEIDAVAPLAVGLQLSSEGAAVALRLGINDVATSAELRLLARRGPGAAVTLAHVLAQPTWRKRARLLRALIFPSAAYLRAWDGGSLPGGASLGGVYWRRLRRGVRAVPPAVRGLAGSRRRQGRG